MSDATQVVLVGLSGSGKSTVGKILAQLLGWRFVDLDQLIEAKTTLTVAEIFARHGEERFRQWEADATRLTIDEGEQRTLDLSLRSAPSP